MGKLKEKAFYDRTSKSKGEFKVGEKVLVKYINKV